ncbi:protein IMPACT-B-like [Panonychus citri]|uniref:protein IMPACT-B-like n=1 Tax=Panonychus citri TaxID=50023 RepID=UPI0023075500|nr:protein IMPACT-B-like [Panonychus citri]
MDNETLRKYEIEALSAIYGDDLMLEEEESHGFSVTLTHPEENEKTIKLDIRFSLDYPLNGPPYYTLSAPWMSRNLKSRLVGELNTIYLDNQGESILYMWIEKAREYFDKDENVDSINGSTNETTGGNSITPDNNCDEQLTPSLHGNKYQHCSGKLNEDIDEGGDGGGGGDENDENAEYKYEEFDYHHYHHHKDHNGVANDIKFVHGEPIVDRRSVFQAHICPVDCIVQVQSALVTLKANKKIDNATHNIVAYRIAGGGGGSGGGSSHHTFIQDFDDDGETAAGARLLHLLQILDVKNVLVVVSRWYGGVNLGADRFKHINNVARDLLVKCGYIEAAVQEKSNSNRKKKSK